jgi:soluble lytic murein transglycosylase
MAGKFLKVSLISLCVLAAVVGLLVWGGLWWRRWNWEQRFDPAIKVAAARYKIDPALVKAVIWQESRFNPRAKGRVGEIGLMQVQEIAAMEWADAEHLTNFEHAQIWEPTRNIHAGTWYLARVLKRYTNTDDPLPYALADYNAGRAHVLQWNKGAAATNSEAFLAQMDFPGTKQYALNVMERYRYYREKGEAGRRKDK